MSKSLISIYTKDLKELDIDESLNRKIIQNEGKLHTLFNVPKKNKKNHSTEEKGIIRERNQKNNKYKKIIKLSNSIINTNNNSKIYLKSQIKSNNKSNTKSKTKNRARSNNKSNVKSNTKSNT